jgi:Protein of unknown function (DUF2877)
MTTSHAVASVLLRDVLSGPVRPGTVVATGPVASYVDVGGRLLAVVRPGGVQLPCAIVLTGDGPTPGGVGLAVGDGAIYRHGDPIVAVTRWFDPRVRLRGVDRAAIARFAALVSSRRRADPLLPVDAIDRLADGLACGDVQSAVAALLGRGTGLTPAGDDLVAGVLAALRAVGSPAADELGMHVRALAPVATTRLSAALLEAADVGAVVPEAVAVLRALAGVEARPGNDDGPGVLEAATDRLVGLGHTSGWHLAAGLVVGVSHAQRPTSASDATGSALASAGSAS